MECDQAFYGTHLKSMEDGGLQNLLEVKKKQFKRGVRS